MIKELMDISNALDSRGLLKEADLLDRIMKLASDEVDNIISFPSGGGNRDPEERMADNDLGVMPSLFNESGSFSDYKEALSELASTIGLLSDMNLDQRDWDSFGKETILEQISGFDASNAPQDLMLASEVPESDFSEVEDDGVYTDYAYAVEVTLRLLATLSDDNSALSRDLAEMDESRKFAIIKQIMVEHLKKIQPLLRTDEDSGDSSLDQGAEDMGSENVLSFPPREGDQDPDSLDLTSLDLRDDAGEEASFDLSKLW